MVLAQNRLPRASQGKRLSDAFTLFCFMFWRQNICDTQSTQQPLEGEPSSKTCRQVPRK